MAKKKIDDIRKEVTTKLIDGLKIDSSKHTVEASLDKGAYKAHMEESGVSMDDVKKIEKAQGLFIDGVVGVADHVVETSDVTPDIQSITVTGKFGSSGSIATTVTIPEPDSNGETDLDHVKMYTEVVSVGTKGSKTFHGKVEKRIIDRLCSSDPE